MKRIIFCFDGTSNVIEAVHPTNVVTVAASIADLDRKDVQQIVYYDEGVGSTKEDKISGGAFGKGLHRNVLEAYKFLTLNYRPDDEIFIFGFSRGAFTARSFSGLLNYCSIMQRCYAEKVFHANWYYQNRLGNNLFGIEEVLRFKHFYGSPICTTPEDDEWRVKNIPSYKRGNHPPLKIKYIGVWDTVKTLGWYKTAKEHAYHSHELNSSILSGRHAVSIDEARSKFDITLWNDVDDRNREAGFKVDDPKRPFQQVWFPGVHGGVGGGGNIRGLSDQAFEWVMDGARKAGLSLNTAEASKIYGFKPDALASIKNVSKPRKNFNYYLMRMMRKIVRQGPKALYEVSPSAIIRWGAPADMLPEKQLYRPGSLLPISNLMDQAASAYDEGLYRRRKTYVTANAELPETVQIEGQGFNLHVVGGDGPLRDLATLGSIAKHYYKSSRKYTLIQKANATMITNLDRIYEQQILLIPHIDRKELA